MKIITQSRHSIAFKLNGADVEFELRHKPDTEDIYIRNNDSKVVIGYLLHELEPPHPLKDWDGNGMIHSLNRRHIDSIDPEKAKAILDTNTLAVPLSYFEHGSCRWSIAGSMSNAPDFKWDGTEFAGVWVPDSCAVSEIRRRARVYSIGTITDLKLVGRGALRYRAHLDGNAPSFFMSWGEAFDFLKNLTPSKARANRLGLKRAAEEIASEACDLYTAYCNGEHYRIVVQEYDSNGDPVNLSDDDNGGWFDYFAARNQMEADVDAALSRE